MEKLILKSTTLHSLNDSESIEIGDLLFDISQFRVPVSMVVPKEGIIVKLEKEKNFNGELVETGKYTLIFKTYDFNFIKLVIQNGSTEIGNPITVIIEGQNDKPNAESFEEGEFIPISFRGLKVKPKKVNKKVFVGQGKAMVDAWIYDTIKIEADGYSIGKVNESKEK
ncbi:peptidase [Clostridium sp. YIM B02506]|uniref:peptidase n=1 Tax=Clostridium sp. YIM B02506 TaxID=2910680 RepID=UPI001EEF4E29|nr:peptidase [Clostridium sp. YIM B02506]